MAAPKERLPLVTLRDALILPGRWRNFGGEERFGEKGKRNFNVKLEEDVALAMQNDGFNIKPLRALDEDDENDGYRLDVAVSYSIRPPQVWLVTGGQRTLLDEGALNILDYADIARASIAINPSAWDVNGNQGIKAYLHKLIVWLREDDLDEEMRDIPIAGHRESEFPSFDD